jgi:membrane protein DedA with SNARE-associated domain
MAREWLLERLFKVVWISRFLSGVRMPTYTARGFLGARFSAFILAGITATLVWTTGLFAISIRIGDFLMAHLGVWQWAGAAGTLAFLLLASRSIAHLRKARVRNEVRHLSRAASRLPM